jgi:hypothetical protein
MMKKLHIVRNAGLMPLIWLAIFQGGGSGSVEAQEAAIHQKSKVMETIHHRHLEGVGLVLWGMDELTASPRELSEDVRAGPLFRPLLKTQQKIDAYTNGVGVLRVQDGLDVTLAEPQAATYQWVDDKQLGNYWNLDAAALLDIYFPNFGRFLGYDPERWGFHLRLGAAWERNTLTEQETDRREFFAGVAFQPGIFDQIGRSQITDMQFGLLYRDDVVADASQWVLTLNIQPTFPLIRQRRFVLGQKLTFKELLDGSDAAPVELLAGQSSLETEAMKAPPSDFIFLRPNFSVDSILDSVAENGEVDLSDFALTYGGRLGFSLFRQRVTLSYNLLGISPIEDLGRSHLFHEGRIEYQPYRELALRFTLAYQYGERAPDFRDEERLILSAGLRF